MQLNHTLNHLGNHLDSYLDIKVLAQKTVVSYWNNQTLVYAHEYPVGNQKIDQEAVSLFVISDWLSGVIFCLNNISLYDRVPTKIYLAGEKHHSILEKVLREKKTYAQFYLGEKGQEKNIHVIINKINNHDINQDYNNKNNLSYERYTKTISQFKY